MIKKEIENEILKELLSSETFWTDLYPFMKRKSTEYSFNDFHKVLKELVEEEIIKAENENSFNDLKLTKKGKLVGKNELTFKLNKKGYLEIENAKLQNEKLEYELTIRNQKERIRNLTERLTKIKLLKAYWWLLGIIFMIGLYFNVIYNLIF